jgi:hypothetical protein
VTICFKVLALVVFRKISDVKFPTVYQDLEKLLFTFNQQKLYKTSGTRNKMQHKNVFELLLVANCNMLIVKRLTLLIIIVSLVISIINFI